MLSCDRCTKTTLEKTNMKKVVFHQIELFQMFAFILQQKYKLETTRYKKEWYEYPALECDDFVLIFKEDGIENIEFVERYADIFVTDFYSMYEQLGNGQPLYPFIYEYMNDGLKCLIVDAESESILHFNQFRDIDDWKEEVTEKENLYVVSQRTFLEEIEDKIITNEIQLPLFYYFYHLSDNLFLQPILPEFSLKDKKYDFISYCGLATDYNSKQEWRTKILGNIDFGNKRLYLPQSYKNRKPIQGMMEEFIGWPTNNFGSYNWFSLIESEQAKIKIVFETQSPDDIPDNIYSFISEKTLKCFLHNQPYFIFLKKIHREKLEEIGFKFVGPSDENELTEYISNLCEGDIDEWIEEHKDVFIHNKSLLYQLIYDTNNKHTTLLEKLIYGKSI